VVNSFCTPEPAHNMPRQPPLPPDPATRPEALLRRKPAFDRSAISSQRATVIVQRKKLRDDIDVMRMEMQQNPSRTARQRLAVAERSLAELDALDRAQTRGKDKLMTYDQQHKRAARVIQLAWRERQLRVMMEAQRGPLLELIGLPVLSWRTLTDGARLAAEATAADDGGQSEGGAQGEGDAHWVGKLLPSLGIAEAPTDEDKAPQHGCRHKRAACLPLAARILAKAGR
jgi:hypothetical protein